MNFRRLMKKKEVEETLDHSTTSETSPTPPSSNSMVDIVVRMKHNDTFANLKVSSFDLILSLEFLLKITQFVTVPEDSKSSTSAAAPGPMTSSTIAKRMFFSTKN